MNYDVQWIQDVPEPTPAIDAEMGHAHHFVPTCTVLEITQGITVPVLHVYECRCGDREYAETLFTGNLYV